MNATSSTDARTETRPHYETGQTLASVCPEHGDPTGYSFQCGCGCGTYYEAYSDWLAHALRDGGYPDTAGAERDLTCRYRTGEETSMFAALNATVDEAAATGDGQTAYVTVCSAECHHLYADCPYFPSKYKKTTVEATRKRRCSHCASRYRRDR